MSNAAAVTAYPETIATLAALGVRTFTAATLAATSVTEVLRIARERGLMGPSTITGPVVLHRLRGRRVIVADYTGRIYLGSMVETRTGEWHPRSQGIIIGVLVAA